MCEIELTLRRGANLPRIEFGKDKVEEYKLEIQEMLSVLNVPSSLDENLGVGERPPRLAPVSLQLTNKPSGSKSGTPSASPFLCGVLMLRVFFSSRLQHSSL